MTFEFAHNFLRKLMNVEWGQLPFLNDGQKDNFFANPHTFFIRADDETARKIWDVLYPKPPQAQSGVVVRGPSQWWTPHVRKAGVPVSVPAVQDFEYDTGRPFPDPLLQTSDFVHRHTYAVN